MNHNMKLTENPFERIKNNSKSIEVRLFDEKRKTIEIGDTITFHKLPSLKESIKVRVIGLSRFNDFRTLFSIFGNKEFGKPNDFTIEEQISGMREIYSRKKENKYGVLGIHIQLLS